MIDELSDNELFFELSPSRTPQGSEMQLIEDAIGASLRAFATTIETDIERYAVLEEISKKCVTIWFRFYAKDGRKADKCASAIDPALLKYVTEGVVTFLSWMEGRQQLRLSDLQKALRVLAWGISANSSTRPVVPTSAELMKAIVAWEGLRETLCAQGTAQLITAHGSATLDLSKRIPVLTDLLDRKLVNREQELILLVERPDYGATGEWVLKHGETRFTAECRTCELLQRFHNRQLDIRPGDALRCKVEFDTSYGPDNEVVEETMIVTAMLELLPASVSTEEESDARGAQEIYQRTAANEKSAMLVF